MAILDRFLRAARDDTSTPSSTDKFLSDIQNPFKSELQQDALISSLAFTLPLTILIALLFCFIRPYNNVVYAPRAKYADSKHAPPPITKGLFSWIKPLVSTKESDLVERVGLDAAVFMRVNRMFRNIFTVLAVIGSAVLIPTVLVANAYYKGVEFPTILQPQQVKYESSAVWVYVVVAYLFDIIIMYYLWANYRHIVRLRRDYFNSADYQRSLHARTLMVTDIPKELRSDEGIARLTDEVKATHDMPRTAIARNVKDLPDLVEEYEKCVRELEEHLAKYLKNPDRLPAKRPTCKPHKNDKSYGTYPSGSKVDAIEYLTGRVKELEREIREVRQSVDKRNPMPYGFASYESIPVAHGVAYAARNKGPQGTAIRLAPKPNDIIWKNLKLPASRRKTQNIMNAIWVTLLTIAWVPPNILIAVFLSNLSALGDLWPAFQSSLERYRVFWSIVQGVLAPAITTFFYLYLPAIFRKMSMNAGDVSKTSRERHVARSLYSFFCFNNLIVFSLFSSFFSLILAMTGHSSDPNNQKPTNAEEFLTYFYKGLCNVSLYWLCWLLQRNMGTAVDLAQLVTLAWGSFSRRYLSPTPRRLIELSAPQPFDYAGYYNYFLFVSTVAICFAPIQPLVLVVTALYFWIDSFIKKYLLLYVFITKYESGGMFWRSIYNRTLILTFLGNLVIALTLVCTAPVDFCWPKLAALVPLPVLLVAFKVYCTRAFDDEIHFYQKGQAIRDSEIVAGEEGMKKRKGDRVAVRFGHPVLFKPLITPMVASKSQHMLKQIYTGRTSMEDTAAVAGYSDVYMDNMDNRKPGKQSAGSGPQGWEVVNENQMDFEHYKNRPEFRDEAGGDGELYGHAADLVRPGTPSSINTLTRNGTWDSEYAGYGHSRSASGSRDMSSYPHSRSGSHDSDLTKVDGAGGGGGMEYPRGYHQTPSNLREASPAPGEFGRAGSRPDMYRHGSREVLVSTAAGMGRSTPDHFSAAGGYGQIRYGNVPGQTPGSTPGEEDTSYDYFRRGREQAR